LIIIKLFLKFQRYSVEWLEWIYCKGLIKADFKTWNNTANSVEIYEKRTFETFLTCSNDSDIIINYYRFIKEKNIKDIKKVRIFLSIIAKHANNNVTLSNILH